MPIIEKEIPSQILRAFPGHAKKIMWPTLWGTLTQIHTYICGKDVGKYRK